LSENNCLRTGKIKKFWARISAIFWVPSRQDLQTDQRATSLLTDRQVTLQPITLR
jgi:hypothetical protein